MKYEEFIKAIRTKYPEYNDVDDDALADSVLRKYPVYKEQIDPVVPYNPDKEYYPGPYAPVELGEPEDDKEPPPWWDELKRTMHKGFAELPGTIGGTVMNILGTVPEGEHPTFTGYGMALMPDVDPDEVPEAIKYVDAKEAKKTDRTKSGISNW